MYIYVYVEGQRPTSVSSSIALHLILQGEQAILPNLELTDLDRLGWPKSPIIFLSPRPQNQGYRLTPRVMRI